jgi:hypothetical protein
MRTSHHFVRTGLALAFLAVTTAEQCDSTLGNVVNTGDPNKGQSGLSGMLTPTCRELLSRTSGGTCEKGNVQFPYPSQHLVDVSQTGPEGQYCAFNDGYVAEAINECWSAQCDYVIAGAAQFGPSHEKRAICWLCTVPTLCGNFPGTVTCEFIKTWSCSDKPASPDQCPPSSTDCNSIM